MILVMRSAWSTTMRAWVSASPGVLEDQPRAPGDDVQRRAQLVGDAGCQPPHGRQPLGVTELLQRGDATQRRRAHLGRGRLQAIEHLVQLARQLAQLVVLARLRARPEVARGHPARLRDQARDRRADQPGTHQQRDQHHRDRQHQRGGRGRADGPPDVGAQIRAAAPRPRRRRRPGRARARARPRAASPAALPRVSCHSTGSPRASAARSAAGSPFARQIDPAHAVACRVIVGADALHRGARRRLADRVPDLARAVGKRAGHRPIVGGLVGFELGAIAPDLDERRRRDDHQRARQHRQRQLDGQLHDCAILPAPARRARCRCRQGKSAYAGMVKNSSKSLLSTSRSSSVAASP